MGTMTSRVRVVLGNSSLVGYPQAGGLWTIFLQYLLGLRALGHDAFWLETMRSTGNSARDQHLIGIFFKRFAEYGLGDRCAVLVSAPNSDSPTIDSAEIFGKSRQELREITGGADFLWNFCAAIKEPLLSLFRRRVFIDLDPGHLQVSALTWDVGLREHDAFLSVGRKMRDADCQVPSLGLEWHPFSPFVHLPMWDTVADPGPQAPFSSVTQWGWGELWLEDRVLSVSKRDAYLEYVALPQHAGRAFELAANIHPADTTGDRELLLSHGWKIVDPHAVAASPRDYQKYIANSRAEISCPKPIFRELRTGWLSDRTVCYLASGRPVLAQDTGFSDHLPTGSGLVLFHNMEEAVHGAAAIDADYAYHAHAAREVAEEFLDARRCLPAMLAASG